MADMTMKLDGVKLERASKMSQGKGKPEIEGVWTLDFSGVTLEQALEFASRSIVIAHQNYLREAVQKGEAQAIKDAKACTIKVSELGARRATKRPMTPEEMLAYIANLPKEQRQAYMKMLGEQKAA